MKTLLQTFILFFSITALHAKPGANVVFTSETGDRFRLYLDRQIHNVQPSTSVKVQQLEETRVFARIVFETANPHEVSSYVPLRAGEELTYGIFRDHRGRWAIRLRNEAPILGSQITVNIPEDKGNPRNYGGHKPPKRNPSILTGQGSCVRGDEADQNSAPTNHEFVTNRTMCTKGDVSALELIHFKYDILEQSDYVRARFAKNEIEAHCWYADQVALIVETFQKPEEQLEIARYSYLHTLDTENFMTVVQAISTKHHRNALLEFTRTSGGVTQGDSEWVIVDEENDTVHPEVECRVLNDREFLTVKSTLANTPFQTERKELAVHVVQESCLTSAQVRDLLPLLAFDRDRYEIAVLAFERVLDAENGHIVKSAFELTTTQERFEHFLLAEFSQVVFEENVVLMAPMSDADFSRFHKQLKEEAFSSTKKHLVHQAQKTNFMTLHQVGLILQEFNFDSDRLEMAKSLYPKTVEQDDFFLVAEHFTFSSSKKELFEFLDNQT